MVCHLACGASPSSPCGHALPCDTFRPTPSSETFAVVHHPSPFVPFPFLTVTFLRTPWLPGLLIIEAPAAFAIWQLLSHPQFPSCVQLMSLLLPRLVLCFVLLPGNPSC